MNRRHESSSPKGSHGPTSDSIPRPTMNLNPNSKSFYKRRNQAPQSLNDLVISNEGNLVLSVSGSGTKKDPFLVPDDSDQELDLDVPQNPSPSCSDSSNSGASPDDAASASKKQQQMTVKIPPVTPQAQVKKSRFWGERLAPRASEKGKADRHRKTRHSSAGPKSNTGKSPNSNVDVDEPPGGCDSDAGTDVSSLGDPRLPSLAEMVSSARRSAAEEKERKAREEATKTPEQKISELRAILPGYYCSQGTGDGAKKKGKKKKKKKKAARHGRRSTGGEQDSTEEESDVGPENENGQGDGDDDEMHFSCGAASVYRRERRSVGGGGGADTDMAMISFTSTGMGRDILVSSPSAPHSGGGGARASGFDLGTARARACARDRDGVGGSQGGGQRGNSKERERLGDPESDSSDSEVGDTTTNRASSFRPAGIDDQTLRTGSAKKNRRSSKDDGTDADKHSSTPNDDRAAPGSRASLHSVGDAHNEYEGDNQEAFRQLNMARKRKRDALFAHSGRSARPGACTGAGSGSGRSGSGDSPVGRRKVPRMASTGAGKVEICKGEGERREQAQGLGRGEDGKLTLKQTMLGQMREQRTGLVQGERREVEAAGDKLRRDLDMAREREVRWRKRKALDGKAQRMGGADEGSREEEDCPDAGGGDGDDGDGRPRTIMRSAGRIYTRRELNDGTPSKESSEKRRTQTKMSRDILKRD
ncbi:hypothetical protein MKZ38_004425 [Zalerion maritima]|uniref:Uncharacterized protein n=1 Tax=Zalerion maritima TaxID=339359 RepID=A0AAD5WQZ3_9PEZI|nr:hypothetical protein MKZ38_004425 [Zalerion maritima]